MTRVSYSTCDGCGDRDTVSRPHYEVVDINGMRVAHLCPPCLVKAAPLSDLASSIEAAKL